MLIFNILQVIISHTSITTVPQFTLVNTNMIYLDLSFNKIETIHPKAFWSSSLNSRTSHNRLEYLNLRNNNIDYIKSGTFDPLFNLNRIILWNNKITNIEQKLFINIPKIVNIDISNNKLTNLPIKWLPSSLIKLYIEDNYLKRLTRETFYGAINLVTLWLSSDNSIIEENTFTDLSKLTYIFIWHNRNSDIKHCNCNYIWYLKTNSNSKVCLTENNEIRKYLEDNCILSS